jgi:mRNA interferase YafQ
MFELKLSSGYRRDLRRVLRRGYDPKALDKVIGLLLAGKPLPAEYRDHALQGALRKFRECHITGDWLLIYEKDGANLILTLMRTGTHSDLL